MWQYNAIYGLIYMYYMSWYMQCICNEWGNKYEIHKALYMYYINNMHSNTKRSMNLVNEVLYIVFIPYMWKYI